MVSTIAVIAVDIEGVSSPGIIVVGQIDDGASCLEFGLYHVAPLGVGVVGIAQVVGLEQELGILVIFKELNRPEHILAIGTAARDGVVHLLGLPDVAHQVGHGCRLHVVIAVLVLVEHIVPVKDGGLQFGEHHAILRHRVGRHGRGLLPGILPVMEDHGKRGGGATRVAGVGAKGGALVPVGGVLAPIGRNQWQDRLACTLGSEQRRGVDLDAGMSLQEFQLALVAAEPVQHIIRQVADIERLVAIGQDILSPVLARDDDKPCAGVENVKDGGRGRHGAHLGIGQPEGALRGSRHSSGILPVQELLSQGPCGSGVDIGRPYLCCCQQESSNQKKSSH